VLELSTCFQVKTIIRNGCYSTPSATIQDVPLSLSQTQRKLMLSHTETWYVGNSISHSHAHHNIHHHIKSNAITDMTYP